MSSISVIDLSIQEDEILRDDEQNSPLEPKRKPKDRIDFSMWEQILDNSKGRTH